MANCVDNTGTFRADDCDAGYDEVDCCRETSHWTSGNRVTKRRCCPEQGPCADKGVEQGCSYQTGLTTTGCPAGQYEDESCTKTYGIGGWLEYEFCCDTKCTDDNAQCKYQTDWGADCDEGWVEIDECSEESFGGARRDEFCCPLPVISDNIGFLLRRIKDLYSCTV